MARGGGGADVRLSRRLAFVLRHAPESVGLRLDEAGWVDVDALLAALGAHGVPVSRARLDRLVAADPKRRYALDASGTRVRASQGHSVPVDLGHLPQEPPAELFHGTPVRVVPAILAGGLRRGPRHAVHLSPDVATARAVGARRGRAAVLRVDAAAMAADGATFTRSANDVWLVEAVAPRYLAVVEGDPSS